MRYINEIENDFKNIFFNKDRSRKTEVEKENKKLLFLNTLKDLKTYKNLITIEYLKDILNADARIKEYSQKQINDRLSKMFFKLGIKINSFYVNRKINYINSMIIKEVVIPQYRKNDKTEIKNIYPTITEKTFIPGDSFIYMGEEAVKIGYPIKKSIKAVYHAIEI